MPKLDKQLMSEVAETVLKGSTSLFLTPGLTAIAGLATQHETPGISYSDSRQAFADRVADRFRKAFVEKAQEIRKCSELTARKLMQPERTNPSFVQMSGSETGWVFFHPNEDISPADEIGNPAFVYWPTEGGDYQKIPYVLWCRERAKSVWRPVHLGGSLKWEDPPTEAKKPRDAWNALLEDTF